MIKESFLVALEEENFSEMPPEPFITGFIKRFMQNLGS
jgi:cytoskeletal protein RodZ